MIRAFADTAAPNRLSAELTCVGTAMVLRAAAQLTQRLHPLSAGRADAEADR